MTRSPDPEPDRLAPILTPAEREELGGLAFFAAEIDRCRGRGLIPEESYATIVGEAQARRQAIDSRGLARSLTAAAQRLVAQDPRGAIALTSRARRTDPDARAAWELELALLRGLRDDDAAIGLCDQGSSRFPGFLTPDALRLQLRARDDSIAIQCFQSSDVSATV